MKAVVIGTGRIACGVAGQLLRDSGFDVVFVGRNADVVNHLNRLGRYIVRIVDSRKSVDHEVSGIRAVNISDGETAAMEIAAADIVVTSVGVKNLLDIAPVVAGGLAFRRHRANVLAFENFGSSGDMLQLFAQRCLQNSNNAHGFSGAVVTRVVARREGDPLLDEPLVFVADESKTFYVDGTSLLSPLPAIEGMVITTHHQAMVERKLYTFSAGHATAAYLGFLKGYHYIHTAVRDPEVREAVLSAMREGQEALAARYGREIAGDEHDLQEILKRFQNAALSDSIERVGQDPKRKLGSEDRLMGPARLARKNGLKPEKLMLAVAAAMFFAPRADASAAELRKSIHSDGPAAALCRAAGVDPNDTLAASAVRAYCRLEKGKPEKSQLLSLDRLLWS
ncbi:MAG TPA: hypothetical protein VF980_10645 [Thermoanaerobaculia bacterium]